MQWAEEIGRVEMLSVSGPMDYAMQTSELRTDYNVPYL
jgi:hypothetical protein